MLDVGQELIPGKIRNSNSYMMNAQMRRAGTEPKDLGKLTDELDECYDAIKHALITLIS